MTEQGHRIANTILILVVIALCFTINYMSGKIEALNTEIEEMGHKHYNEIEDLKSNCNDLEEELRDANNTIEEYEIEIDWLYENADITETDYDDYIFKQEIDSFWNE